MSGLIRIPTPRTSDSKTSRLQTGFPIPTGGKLSAPNACGEFTRPALTASGKKKLNIALHATESLSIPAKRGRMSTPLRPRNASRCHVTGWNPQELLSPYVSGLPRPLKNAHEKTLARQRLRKLCHAPAPPHPHGPSTTAPLTSPRTTHQLREAMRLPLERAREKCHWNATTSNKTAPTSTRKDAFDDYRGPKSNTTV